MPLLVKFQAASCGTCGMMAKFDSKVAAEEGLDYAVCKITNVDDYVKYRSVLLLKYPDLEGVGYPTYVLVDKLEEPTMLGSFRGGMDKGKFRAKLKSLLG